MTTINNRQQILSLMSKANNKIQVAVSWLTDELLISNLQLMAEKVQVEVLLSNDILNSFRYAAIRQLQLAGGVVLKRGSNFPGQPNFMHAKLLIIDNKEVYGGSFNFTANASSNDENFDQYPIGRVSYWNTIFGDWFKDAEDYQIGFENPEQLKKMVQDKFIAEEAFRKQFLATVERDQEAYVQKELSERDLLIKNEIRREELLQQAHKFKNGDLKVSTEAKMSATGGISAKPHKFYGGSLRTKFAGQKKKNCFPAAIMHKREIEEKFPFLKCRIDNDTVICSGAIQPSGCEKYSLRIEFRAGAFPQVYITNPEIIACNILTCIKKVVYVYFILATKSGGIIPALPNIQFLGSMNGYYTMKFIC